MTPLREPPEAADVPHRTPTSHHIRGDGREGVKIGHGAGRGGLGSLPRAWLGFVLRVRVRGWESERGLPVTPADFGMRTRPQA